MSRFILTLCQRGAERALVAEAERAGLVRAYSSSKGAHALITLKAKQDDRIERFDSIFALHQGVSLGDVDVPRADITYDLRNESVPLVVSAPRAGDVVTTEIIDDKGKRWITQHTHARFGPHFPQRALPADAPSRAWLKIDQALARFELTPRAGERALEIGSAPGGATWNLLKRDVDVVGMDPNEMAAEIEKHPRFVHVQTTSLSAPELAGPFHWLLLDVNVPPGTALRGLAPYADQFGPHLHGSVLTLKLKSWDIVDEIPDWLRRIRRMMPALDHEAVQLWAHGREICVVGRRSR